MKFVFITCLVENAHHGASGNGNQRGFLSVGCKRVLALCGFRLVSECIEFTFCQLKIAAENFAALNELPVSSSISYRLQIRFKLGVNGKFDSTCVFFKPNDSLHVPISQVSIGLIS